MQPAGRGPSPSLEDISIDFHLHHYTILEMKVEGSHDRLKIYSEEAFH